jgi:hypothetical protein
MFGQGERIIVRKFAGSHVRLAVGVLRLRRTRRASAQDDTANIFGMSEADL